MKEQLRVEKDVILAIMVGILIGGLTALFTLFLPKFIKKQLPKSGQQVKEAGKEEIAPIFVAPSYSFTVESPEDEAMFSQDKISVLGNSLPGALITVVSPIDESVTEADDKGVFKTEVLVEEGANEISITSYHKGKEETQTITVYYTEEEI